MRVKLDEGAYLPERAHETDAGLDLRSRESKLVPAHGSALFDTGVHVELPSGTCGLLVSKSGLNTKWNLTSTGLIDESYVGSIAVNLQNHSDMDYFVYKGDKISQLVIMPCLYEKCEQAEEINGTRKNGFGSTGR
jgi:dUTP pyrophosphatase